jgi:hypothetical protein
MNFYNKKYNKIFNCEILRKNYETFSHKESTEAMSQGCVSISVPTFNII